MFVVKVHVYVCSNSSNLHIFFPEFCLTTHHSSACKLPYSVLSNTGSRCSVPNVVHSLIHNFVDQSDVQVRSLGHYVALHLKSLAAKSQGFFF